MGKIREAKRAIQLKNWKEEVEAQMSSGMTVSEWCRANNVVPKNYYYHLRRVREFFLDLNEQQTERQEIVSVTEISKPLPKFESESAANVVIRKDPPVYHSTKKLFVLRYGKGRGGKRKGIYDYRVRQAE